MSYSQSSLTTESFTTALSGNNGVAYNVDVGGNSLLYNSLSSNSTWTLQTTLSSTTISGIVFSSTNAIAVGVDTSNNPIISYSLDSGTNWQTTLSSLGGLINTNNGINVALDGLNGIACLNYTSGSSTLYYTADGGATWNLSDLVAVSSLTMNRAAISGANAIMQALSGNSFIYYSTNSGASWAVGFSCPSGVFPFNIGISGSSAIIVGTNSGSSYIQISSNGGQTWADPTSGLSTPIFGLLLTRVSISPSFVITGGVLSGTSKIYYSTNSGVDWLLSDLSLTGINSLSSLSTSSTNGVASLNINGTGSPSTPGSGYIYFTDDSGATWTQKLFLDGTSRINNVVLSGNYSIAGTTAVGVYYASSPLCYEKNTLILVVENDEEVYKKVSELKVGDVVKTYKNDNKKVKLIRSFAYKPFNKKDDLYYLYKMKDHDVILTAGHSILVDELTEEEQLNNNKHNFNNTIEDKKLLLACSSDKFEKIEDDLEYELWHFALENDDINMNYGVYINDGVLSESCSEAEILKIL